jgi:hypothetical protein
MQHHQQMQQHQQQQMQQQTQQWVARPAPLAQQAAALGSD